MKRKSSLAVIIALAALIARAFILIVIGILCLLVGSYAIYKLLGVMNRWLPPAPDQTRNQNYRYATTNVSNPTNGAPFKFDLSEDLAQGKFVVHYGLNGDFSAWVSAEPLTDTEPFMGEVTLIDEEYRYAIAVFCNGTTYVVDCAYTPDGVELFNTVTMINPSAVAVERSTNVTDWTEVFSDAACPTYGVSSFTDTNAPVSRAFYRLRVDKVGEIQ